MKCAACGQPMMVVEHDGIELDYCPDCGGVWFDSGEIDLLMEKMGVESSGLEGLHLAPEAASSEDTRKCPICHKRMKKVKLGHEPELLIDACPDGDGLWLDHGETGQLVKHLAAHGAHDADSQERVIKFLGEVFSVAGQE